MNVKIAEKKVFGLQLKIRDRITGKFLDPDMEYKFEDQPLEVRKHWIRLIKDGDLEIVE